MIFSPDSYKCDKHVIKSSLCCEWENESSCRVFKGTSTCLWISLGEAHEMRGFITLKGSGRRRHACHTGDRMGAGSTREVGSRESEHPWAGAFVGGQPGVHR